MKYKITVDINLMHENPAIPAMDTLKRWVGEGKLELIESEPPRLVPGAPPKAPPPKVDTRWGTRTRVAKELPGAVKFKNVAAVLFPKKDSQKLDMSEINDVARLVKHHGSRNEIFVTNNQNFLEMRDSLKAAYGTVTMTPQEVVGSLSSIEGWK